MDLSRRSIETILENQADSGAYVASPSFAVYRHCWLRDGSFTAHAMDRVGEHESARAFFRWVDRTIRAHAWKVEAVLRKTKQGLPVDEGDWLHTRYTLDGKETQAEWWNFQLDGYGAWLWALKEHVEASGDVTFLAEVATSVELTVRYLSALWNRPNYDCWEENAEYLHPYSLAAIFGGLRSAEGLARQSGMGSLAPGPGLTERLRAFVLDHGVHEEHVVKSFPPPGQPHTMADGAAMSVDASLLGLATPYRLLTPDDQLMRKTVARVEEDLHFTGGVHRYQADTYYGGGEWVLLTAWLGWYYAELGETSRATELLCWVEAQADADGLLPEQVSGHLLAPAYYAQWTGKWGPVAKPLLWSHAMYLILFSVLGSGGRCTR